jgi:hypothetical protein
MDHASVYLEPVSKGGQQSVEVAKGVEADGADPIANLFCYRELGHRFGPGGRHQSHPALNGSGLRRSHQITGAA